MRLARPALLMHVGATSGVAGAAEFDVKFEVVELVEVEPCDPRKSRPRVARVDILGVSYEVRFWTSEEWAVLDEKPRGSIAMGDGSRCLFTADVEALRRDCLDPPEAPVHPEPIREGPPSSTSGIFSAILK